MSRWEWLKSKAEDGWKPPGTLRLVIAGVPRGGTTYTANMLDQVVEAAHEGVFCAVGLRKTPTSKPVEVSGFAGPWVERLYQCGVPVVQLFRNPVDCVSSFYNHFREGWTDLTVKDACEFYFETHKEIIRYASKHVKLETWRRDIEKIQGLLPDVCLKAMDDIGHSPSRWSKPKLSWEALTNEVRDIALEVGY